MVQNLQNSKFCLHSCILSILVAKCSFKLGFVVEVVGLVGALSLELSLIHVLVVVVFVVVED